METLYPQLPPKEVNQMNMLALAHVGDAVYELLVRSMLCREKKASVMQLHRLTVEQVRAEAQAEAVKKLLPHLDEEELAVYKRGRNTKVNSAPHHAGIAQYHAATGLEALFGWLYLQGRNERIGELFTIIMEE
ncbi:MAG: ribonuclease III [Oscillospiraceae bacterium]|nr:ribonuclease III [Oscillospiraceae bacterium]